MSKTNNPGHLAKNFLTNIYGSFARDLVDYGNTGITEDQCEKNKEWLQKISLHAAELPDGFIFGKKVYERCDAINLEYAKWNDAIKGDGGIDLRRKQIDRIKSKINKLSSSVRKRTLKLETEADIQPYKSMYAATGKLIEAVPDLLKNVAKTYSQFPDEKSI